MTTPPSNTDDDARRHFFGSFGFVQCTGALLPMLQATGHPGGVTTLEVAEWRTVVETVITPIVGSIAPSLDAIVSTLSADREWIDAQPDRTRGHLVYALLLADEQPISLELFPGSAYLQSPYRKQLLARCSRAPIGDEVAVEDPTWKVPLQVGDVVVVSQPTIHRFRHTADIACLCLQTP